jgi:hypothetical protein
MQLLMYTGFKPLENHILIVLHKPAHPSHPLGVLLVRGNSLPPISGSALATNNEKLVGAERDAHFCPPPVVVLLLRPLWPGEEKPTRRAVLKTVACGAVVETELSLN